MTGSPSTASATTSPRIPLGLQAVFIASNRGEEVHKAPPEKQANKTYIRSWIFGGGRSKKRNSSKSNTEKNFEDDKLKGNNRRPLPSVVQFQKSSDSPSSDEKQEQEEKDHTRRRESLTKATRPSRPPMSPQAFLDVLINSRGYSTRRYRSLQTGYYAKPTAFQQASYDVYLVKLLRNNNVETLRDVLTSGISPNPCNAFGESFIHMVCRRGDSHILKIMLESVGSSVQVSDDYGRYVFACIEYSHFVAPLLSSISLLFR